MKLSIIFAALLALALAADASAQWTSSYGYTFNNPMSATINNMMWNSIQERQVYKVGLRARGFTDAQMDAMSTEELKAAYIRSGVKKPTSSASAKTPPTPQRSAIAATKFTPTATRILMPQMVAEFTTDKAQQKALVDLFSNAMREYESQAKLHGIENDVAGAIGYFASIAFFLQDGTTNDKGTVALSKSIRDSMNTAEYAKISGREKQQFYEFMLTMGTFLLVSAQDSGEKELKELRDVSAAVSGKFLGLYPTKYRLTDEGLAAR